MKTIITAISFVLISASAGNAYYSCPTPAGFKEALKAQASAIGKAMTYSEQFSSWSSLSEADITLKQSEKRSQEPYAKLEDVETTCEYLINNAPVFGMTVYSRDWIQ